MNLTLADLTARWRRCHPFDSAAIPARLEVAQKPASGCSSKRCGTGITLANCLALRWRRDGPPGQAAGAGMALSSSLLGGSKGCCR